ncbi:helix-turn-helix domain-containing protein [Harryflintia acetispora]|uniref:PocR sensory domain-containing protein n=1 Tax=Harryflintia acetispora TaxID=1849041 RepID=A0A9X8UI57_9FIRM|nr:helix-turn-helix domain-containing protein [Harryflintia acetispora]TCL42470.1 PocR sensory domain-containing protein [Harryflintia acetispora]
MQKELQERVLQCARHFENLCGVQCVVVDTREERLVETCEERLFFCGQCRHERRDIINTYLYGASEAYRWNGSYVYYCPMGLVFAASSISCEQGELCGAIVAGPLVMGPLEDNLADIPDDAVRERTAGLPNFSTARVNDLVAVLSSVAAHACGVPHGKVGSFIYEQEEILKTLYNVQTLYRRDEGHSYPIEYERQLQQFIRQRDKDGSKLLLNQLLGQVFLASEFDLEQSKARIMELVVLLSRAAIDAGADINEIFCCNTSYIRAIEQMDSMEDLSVWITGIMHRFISYSFDFSQVKHSDVVFKVMEYVKNNYDKKLTLDEIAGSVYLSKSYLSSIFREESGYHLSHYINKVRVEKSKMMLLDGNARLIDIANLCGFEDQSYFTKVFKRFVGMSPKAFRDSRGEIDK